MLEIPLLLFVSLTRFRNDKDDVLQPHLTMELVSIVEWRMVLINHAMLIN
jgi:hypothetical protein